HTLDRPVAMAPSAPSAAPRRRPSLGRVLAWTALAVIILITLFPFFSMLRTALSSNSALAADPRALTPVGFSWRGFERVFGLQTAEEAIAHGGSGAAMDFWRYLRNSVVVAPLVTVGQVLFSAMAAFAFSRLRWRGRDVVFG